MDGIQIKTNTIITRTIIKIVIIMGGTTTKIITRTTIRIMDGTITMETITITMGIIIITTKIISMILIQIRWDKTLIIILIIREEVEGITMGVVITDYNKCYLV